MLYTKKIAVAAIVMMVSALPAASQAASQAELTRTKRVIYSDLDLTKPADVKVLQHRVDNAIHAVCSDPNGNDIAIWDELVSCSKKSAHDAQRGIALAVSRAQQDQRLAVRKGLPTVALN